MGERTNQVWQGQEVGFYYAVVDAMLTAGFTREEISKVGGGNFSAYSTRPQPRRGKRCRGTARLWRNYDLPRAAAQSFTSEAQAFRCVCPISLSLGVAVASSRGERKFLARSQNLESRTKSVAMLLLRLVASTRRRCHLHLQP